MAALTEMWEEALEMRRAMSPGLPIVVLDALLKAREWGISLETDSKIFSKISPDCSESQLRAGAPWKGPELSILGRGGRI